MAFVWSKNNNMAGARHVAGEQRAVQHGAWHAGTALGGCQRQPLPSGGLAPPCPCPTCTSELLWRFANSCWLLPSAALGLLAPLPREAAPAAPAAAPCCCCCCCAALGLAGGDPASTAVPAAAPAAPAAPAARASCGSSMKLSSWLPFSCSIKSFRMVRRQYTALAAAAEGTVPCGRVAAKTQPAGWSWATLPAQQQCVQAAKRSSTQQLQASQSAAATAHGAQHASASNAVPPTRLRARRSCCDTK